MVLQSKQDFLPCSVFVWDPLFHSRNLCLQNKTQISAIHTVDWLHSVLNSIKMVCRRKQQQCDNVQISAQERILRFPPFFFFCMFNSLSYSPAWKCYLGYPQLWLKIENIIVFPKSLISEWAQTCGHQWKV